MTVLRGSQESRCRSQAERCISTERRSSAARRAGLATATTLNDRKLLALRREEEGRRSSLGRPRKDHHRRRCDRRVPANYRRDGAGPHKIRGFNRDRAARRQEISRFGEPATDTSRWFSLINPRGGAILPPARAACREPSASRTSACGLRSVVALEPRTGRPPYSPTNSVTSLRVTPSRDASRGV